MQAKNKKTWRIFRVIALIIIIPAFVAALAFLISYFNGRRTINVDGTARAYHIHTPRGYDEETPIPLVLVYHMRVGNAWLMQEITRFNRTADENGFIVVYPDGYQRSWADGSGRYEADQAGYDDVAFTIALIDELSIQYLIDPHQIYAAGFSNGGFLLHRLACEIPDRFAGIAAISAVMAEEIALTCDPLRSVPILMMHGTSDLDLPWRGKPELLSVPETLETWLEINQCQSSPQIETWDKIPDDGTSIRRETYHCQGQPVVFYSIEGGGHRWPGGSFWQYWLSGFATQELEANRIIWEFFEAQKP